MPQHRFGGQIEAEAGISVMPGVTVPATDTLINAGSPYTLSVDDSGKTFLVVATTGVNIILPTPVGNPGLSFRFLILTTAAQNVTIQDGGAGNLFIGTIVDTGPLNIAACAGTTITFVGGTGIVGDMVEVFSAGGLWCARCVTGAGNGITVA